MIVCVKHIDIEGPGTMGVYLTKQGYSVSIIELEKGEPLPEDLSDIEAVIILGGPMNVYEEDKYPYLKAENRFIKNIIAEDIPTMGICLGSQLIAKACGASVVKSPVKEIGFYGVDLTEEAAQDPLLKGLGPSIPVFQWHEDTFHIPKQGTLLATGKGCRNQALKVGKNVYGMQFHVEITDQSIREWSDEYIREHRECRQLKNDLLREYKLQKKAFNQTAEKIYANFRAIIESRKVLA